MNSDPRAASVSERSVEPVPERRKRAWFAGLFDAELDFVGRCLRSRGVPSADLPDACQEVFMIAHRRRDDVIAGTSPRPWLYRISVNVALNQRRTNRRRREDLYDSPPEASSDASPHRAAELRQDLAIANDLLSSLDEDKREVFVLHVVEEVPMADIASSLGIPAKTGYSRLSSARKQLAAALRRRNARRTA